MNYMVNMYPCKEKVKLCRRHYTRNAHGGKKGVLTILHVLTRRLHFFILLFTWAMIMLPMAVVGLNSNQATIILHNVSVSDGCHDHSAAMTMYHSQMESMACFPVYLGKCSYKSYKEI